MLAANNLPAVRRQAGHCSTQDMVLGSYYLTIVKPEEPGATKGCSKTRTKPLWLTATALWDSRPIRVRMEKGRRKRSHMVYCRLYNIQRINTAGSRLCADRSKPETSSDLRSVMHPKDPSTLK